MPSTQLPTISAQKHADLGVVIGVVIGADARHATLEEATAAIAGHTVANEVTARGLHDLTTQWPQGDIFEHGTPVGPRPATGSPGRFWHARRPPRPLNAGARAVTWIETAGTVRDALVVEG